MKDIVEFMIDEHPGLVIITDDESRIIKTNHRAEIIVDNLIGAKLEKVNLFKELSIVEAIMNNEITYGYQEYKGKGIIYYSFPTPIDGEQQGHLTIVLAFRSKIENIADMKKELQQIPCFNSKEMCISLFNTEGKIVYLNQSILNKLNTKLNVDFEYVVNKKTDFFLESLTSKDIKSMAEKSIKKGNLIQSRLFTRLKQTGEKYILDVTSFPVIIKGKVIGAISFAADAEDILQHTKKLKQANRIENVRKMAFRVIHEIRNPLQEIMAASGMGELKAEDDEIKFYFQKINNKVKRINNLLNENLQLFDSGEIELVRLKVKQLLSIIKDSIYQECKEKRIDFLVELENDDLEIIGDENLILRAIKNVIENAIEFLQNYPGDRKIKIKSWGEGNDILFSIYNSGPPIPSEIRDDVFDLFSSTKGTNGAGLGLTITYYIVTKIYQGDIWFESNREGTTFYIKLENGINQLDIDFDTLYKGINS
ncbi:hypothetical protein JCM16358_26400 [Halanaerocella petrolearia]